MSNASRRIKEHLRELMPFKRAVVEQAQQRGIFAMYLQDLRGDREKYRTVIPLAHSILAARPELLETLARFVIDNGRVEILFGLKVSEDDRLAHTYLLGDLLGGRAPEAVARKQLRRYLHYLAAPVLAAHPLLARYSDRVRC